MWFRLSVNQNFYCILTTVFSSDLVMQFHPWCWVVLKFQLWVKECLTTRLSGCLALNNICVYLWSCWKTYYLLKLYILLHENSRYHFVLVLNYLLITSLPSLVWLSFSKWYCSTGILSYCFTCLKAQLKLNFKICKILIILCLIYWQHVMRSRKISHYPNFY